MLKEAEDRQRHRRQAGEWLTAGVPRHDSDQQHYLQHSLPGSPPAAALPKSHPQTPAVPQPSALRSCDTSQTGRR